MNSSNITFALDLGNAQLAKLLIPFMVILAALAFIFIVRALASRYIKVHRVATCRISTVPEDLANAVTAFLNKDETYLKAFLQEILKAICAQSSASWKSINSCGSGMNLIVRS